MIYKRTVFEAEQFVRRADMLTLAYAEYIERKGLFTDKLCEYLLAQKSLKAVKNINSFLK